MKIELSYGKTGLSVDVPFPADVIRPRPTAGCPMNRTPSAPRWPTQSVRRRWRIGLSPATGWWWPTPTSPAPPPTTACCRCCWPSWRPPGCSREDITLLNALGTHRQQTPDELRDMLGDFVVDHYRCLQHDAYDDTNLVSLGQTSFGHPVRLNRTLLEADFKILTGFIEPHFFAGFSGGPKGVLPALAGAESVLTNHGYSMIGHPKSTWGVCEGNPIWEEMREMALKVTPSFLVNVTLNVEKHITGVFAGDLLAAHRAGREFVRQHAMVKVPAPYDVVLTTNSGYPLDQNLYQTVKGMSAASQVVRPGGAIVMAAGCADGLPDHGLYAQLLAEAGSPDAILAMLAQPGYIAQDQWQVQVQATIQKKADVYVYSGGLSDEQIRRALFNPCRDISATLAALVEKHGPRVCVMPDGPLTIAYL